MAAVDGIQNKVDPGEPLEKVLEKSDQERLDCPMTPQSLDAALTALENDSEFLMRGEVFSEEVLLNWIRCKRKQEISLMNSRPHPFEFCLYYDV